MSDTSLWDRYHHLLQEYLDHGDEGQLRKVVALSQERGLALETTSGRVAASVRAVLSAYSSVGAQSMVVDVDRRRQSHEELREAQTPDDCFVTLHTPESEGDTVVIEVRGRCPDKDLPIVRLDYVTPDAAQATARSAQEAQVAQPIEPRQLYDVLTGLLARDPERPNESAVPP